MSRKLNEINMKANIFPQSLIIFVIWTTVTAVVGAWMTGGNATLDELVKDGVMWSALLAGLIVVGAVYFLRVKEETGITPLASNATWVPVIVQGVVIALLLFKGLILTPSFSGGQIFWILLNTLFVGISEEMMFRGLLFSGLYKRYSYWVACLGVAVLFGLVHVLNGFITGDFVSGLLQAGLVAFSGLLFMAMRLGMGSIIPVIIMHWLWDFSIFINPPEGVGEGIGLIVGLIAVVSPPLFGIIGLIVIGRLRKRIEG